MPADSASHGLPGVGGPGRRTWQKIGWSLLAVFVGAGAAGALGNGPLSRVSLSHGDVRIEYERVLRMRAPTELRVSVAQGAPARLEVAVESANPSDIELEGVVPEPLHTRASERGPVYELATHDGAIRFALRAVPRRLGYTETRLSIGAAEPVAIRQLVLP
jgi:hypothetical protein